MRGAARRSARPGPTPIQSSALIAPVIFALARRSARPGPTPVYSSVLLDRLPCRYLFLHCPPVSVSVHWPGDPPAPGLGRLGTSRVRGPIGGALAHQGAPAPSRAATDASTGERGRKSIDRCEGARRRARARRSAAKGAPHEAGAPRTHTHTRSSVRVESPAATSPAAGPAGPRARRPRGPGTPLRRSRRRRPITK